MSADIRTLYDAELRAKAAAAEARRTELAARAIEARMFYRAFVDLIRPLDGLGGKYAEDGYGYGYDANGKQTTRPHAGIWIDQHRESVSVGRYRYRAVRTKAGALIIEREHSGQPWEHSKQQYETPQEAARAFARELAQVEP